MADLIPPDLARCQCEITTRNPWVMGGPVKTTIRCDRRPKWIATEKAAGPDGLRGAMSLCDSCRKECEKKMGGQHVEFRAIKRWAGNKSLIEIETQCLAAGIDFVDDLWKKGDDHVSIWTRAKDLDLGYVIFNTVNGTFIGKTPVGGDYGPQGTTFNSNSAEHDDKPWFQALLAFFYVETSDEELKRLTAQKIAG